MNVHSHYVFGRRQHFRLVALCRCGAATSATAAAARLLSDVNAVNQLHDVLAELVENHVRLGGLQQRDRHALHERMLQLPRLRWIL